MGGGYNLHSSCIYGASRFHPKPFSTIFLSRCVSGLNYSGSKTFLRSYRSPVLFKNDILMDFFWNMILLWWTVDRWLMHLLLISLFLLLQHNWLLKLSRSKKPHVFFLKLSCRAKWSWLTLCLGCTVLILLLAVFSVRIPLHDQIIPEIWLSTLGIILVIHL